MARLHRQELKHDEFVDSVDYLWHYLEEHGRRVALGAALVVLVVILVGGGLWYWSVQEEQANILFNGAVASFEGQVQEGLPPLPGQEDVIFASWEDKWRTAGEKFAEVARQYPSTHAGRIARHYEGICKFRLGQQDEGIALLEEAAGAGDRETRSLARLHLAGLYAEVGRSEEAEMFYRDLVGAPTDTVPKAMAQFELAVLLSDTRPVEAREILRQIQEEEPDSRLAGEASRLEEMLPPAPES